MKGLLAKLKGMQYKQLLINHGEKIAFGTVALIVMASLAITRWSGFDKKPEELTQKVETSKTALLNNPWPQEERLAPETPSTYSQYAAAMGRPLDYAGLAYNKPLSFPLYQKKPPISEPQWEPLEQLVTYSGRAVLAVQTPPEELGLEEGADPMRTTKNDRLGVAAGHSAGGGKSPMPMPMPTTGAGHGAGGPPGMPPGMDPMSMMGGGALTQVKTRGQRYVSVVGVFNLYKQGKELERAEGTETLQEALSLIEIYDFKLERQKAVQGPDPWAGKWEEVSLERADEILDETTDFALDVLPQIVQDPVMTMPLPQRLNGTWDKHASHPALKGYELSEEYKEMQAKVNAYLMTQEQTLGAENGAEAEVPRRGWSNKQTDMRGVESRLMQGGNMGEVNKGLTDYMKQMGGARGGHNAGGGMPMMPPGMMGMPMMPPGAPTGMGNRNMASMPMNMPMPGAGHGGRGGPPGMMPGMGMGMGSAGATISADTLRYLLVFRYLDFDVNPNEAYRYRVKLLFTNPNFGLPLDQVKDQSVTEGETRESDWSNPSYPAVVDSDNVFNLVRVERSHRDAGKALLNLLNWDPDKGTLINADLLVSLGSYLGGFAETEQLDMGTPSLEKTKDVAFVTRDLLVDTSFAPSLVPAEHPDLKLDVKPSQANKPLDVGIPDQALVVNRYGQVVPIDKSDSVKNIAEAKKQVAEEREPYSYLVDLPEEGNRLDAAGGAPPGMMPGMMMPGMMPGGNPLRRGKGGRAGMMNPQQMMMMTQPGGAGAGHGSGGGNSKKKKTP